MNTKPASEMEPIIDSENKAIEAIKALGGEVSLDESGNVQSVDFSRTGITDAGLVHLKGMTNLEYLDLEGTKVSDAGLVHLKGLTGLRRLHLEDTKVTKEGVKELQTALPKCKIN
ncbi:MAG: hypothetical protein JKY95_16740 [Planctomycetaceae bacterium]|nr:hypothetical protein [Planctomycetaceae bacterium]